MKIFVGQIYIEPGINYPFSLIFQKWLSQKLTELVQPSAKFLKTYSIDYNLIFRISAKTKIHEPEIKGPTVFKRDKNVEFTIFLPHNGIEACGQNESTRALNFLMDGVVTVLQSLDIDAARVVENSSMLIEHICSEPTMIEKATH
jgi:hypothetical protein